VYCMLSGIGLCDELITRPEESYLLCVITKTSWTRRPYAALGSRAGKNTNKYIMLYRMQFVILSVALRQKVPLRYFVPSSSFTGPRWLVFPEVLQP
jgi:hypothetical protein